MTDYSDEQIEALIAAATPGPWDAAEMRRWPGRWDVWDAEGRKTIAEIYWERDAEFVAAARELVPSLLARAQQAEAAVAERLRQFNAAKDQRDAALTEADRLRAELAEAKAEADELRRLLLNETYRPEGGEIVMRELAEAKAEAVERLRQFNAAKDQRDAALAEADRLRAELAEANAENEALRQVAQSDRETAKDYADEIAAAHAERDRLAAQVAAVRALCGEVENRMMATAKPSEIRAALDGTEQDEAKAPIRATCSGGGPSTEPGMALIEFRVPQGTERRLGAEWLLTPVSRPTEGDEQ